MDDAERELQAIAAGSSARSEQSVEGTREIARNVVAFHKELAEGGLPSDLVDQLTSWFADDLLASGRNCAPHDDEDESEGDED